MTHGERYLIEVYACSDSYDAEPALSEHPRAANHTLRPNPVSNVAELVDTRNMTIEWPRPEGRVERYTVRWARDEPDAPPLVRNLTASAAPRVLLDALEPGAGYRVDIVAHSHHLPSETFTLRTRTRPLIQSDISIVDERNRDDDDPPSIKVLYTPTPASATRFDEYRFRLEGGAEPPRLESRPPHAPSRLVVFDNLTPGRLYNLTMWTVSRNVTSHPVQRQARLRPRPVLRLSAAPLGAHEVRLAWAAPPGDFTDYEVQYLAAADEHQLLTRVVAEPELAVGGLRPHTLYNFTVAVRAGAADAQRAVSHARSVEVRTLQAPPPAPRDFRLDLATPSRVSFAWDLRPDEANGVLRRFVLEYQAQDRPETRRAVEFGAEARSGAVEGLAPGGAYQFWLSAETGGGRGEPASALHRMGIAAPPPPLASARPTPLRRTATTAAVRFLANYFSAANGNVTSYTLVACERPGNESSGEPLPSWREVRALPEWPPYQVTEPYYPFGAAASAEFTLGSERCEDGGRKYCNGPLKPGTRYLVKLRAFTAPDKFTDTAYAEFYTEADHTAWMIGGGAAAGALLAALAAALLIRRRRARPARAAPAPPAHRTSRPVRVADFVDHYRLMSADSDFRFSEEFEELKHVGREQPCAAADLPVNRPKNRFTNILPYDHSRYKLQPVDDEEGSDYINANYVPGFSSPREFVVTQGPLHCTRDDFWRMCWESGSRAIVMLTRCVEKGREKCDRYWPYDTRPAYYGDIAVTALNESRYPDWTVTELMLSRGAEQRVLKHFHFTTWPDFGVPEPPTALARFVRAFRERCPADARPVVVHCSAGVGRSGTFITLDTALQHLAHGADHLDIFGMVHAMRRERVWMVQTEQQYICIHQCLVAVLEGQDLAPPHHQHHLNPAFEDDEGIAESGM